MEDSTYTYTGYNANEDIYAIYCTRSNDTLYVEREYLAEAVDTPRQLYVNLFATVTLSGDIQYMIPRTSGADIVLIPFDLNENDGDIYAMPGQGGTITYECNCVEGTGQCGGPTYVLLGPIPYITCPYAGCDGKCRLFKHVPTYQLRPPGLIIDISSNANTGVEVIILLN